MRLVAEFWDDDIIELATEFTVAEEFIDLMDKKYMIGDDADDPSIQHIIPIENVKTWQLVKDSDGES